MDELESKIAAIKAAYPFPGATQIQKEEHDRIEAYKLSIATYADILLDGPRYRFFEKLFKATCQALPITALETGSYFKDWASRHGADVLNEMWAQIDPLGKIERSEAGLDAYLGIGRY